MCFTEITKSAYFITDKHSFETMRFCFMGFKGRTSPNSDYHINLSKGERHFKNKDIISPKALCFSVSPFVAQVNHLFEDTNSKETVLHRSADAISETETTTGYTQKGIKKIKKTLCTRQKKANHSRNLVLLSNTGGESIPKLQNL